MRECLNKLEADQFGTSLIVDCLTKVKVRFVGSHVRFNCLSIDWCTSLNEGRLKPYQYGIKLLLVLLMCFSLLCLLMR